MPVLALSEVTGLVAALAAGGGGYTVLNKTAGYTETQTSGEHIRKCDLVAGFTIVLPTAVGNTAKYHFKKIQTLGTITIDGNGAETIDGGATAALTTLFSSITLVSDGANWIII